MDLHSINIIIFIELITLLFAMAKMVNAIQTSLIIGKTG